MTGFGNGAFHVLSKMRNVDLVAVFTPKRPAMSFPYFRCLHLAEVVSRHKGIQLFEGISVREEKTCEIIQKLCPDLMVVSTFNQILSKNILSIPKLGVINIHPSLLPKYRGPTPTVWVLMNGERETGVSAHFIEDERIDSGRIITRSKLKIHASDTDGTLRQRLASLSEKVLVEAIRLVFRKEKESFPKQLESGASYYPKRNSRDAEIDLQQPFGKIINQIKAMTPYPGAFLKYNGLEYFVRKASLVQNDKPPKGFHQSSNSLFFNILNGIVRFDVRKKVQNG
jgi:methionyl-tRNA formyltransferase